MKIAIVGYGVEGRSSLKYFRRKYPRAEFLIVDQNDIKNPADDIIVHTGTNVFSERLNDVNLVIRTPSIAPYRIHTLGKIWSATNEFFAECPAPIIGVTGTKGKGTVCSMIAAIARQAGKTVYTVGNIGTPGLDVLPQIAPHDVVIYELSSFQLWDLERSPHIAVVLMIEPDHLDVHRTFDEYIDAKSNICRYQQANDITIYHPTNIYSQQIALTSGGDGQAYRYGIPDDFQVYADGVYFMSQNRQVCPTDAVQLPGGYNLDNACAAMSAAAMAFPGISPEVYYYGLRSFTGLPHRLKRVAEKSGVTYYDDSIATTPGSAIAAIGAFMQPKVLILGGHDKGGDYTALAKEIARSNMRVVILMGSNAEKIAQTIYSVAPQTNLIVKGKVPMAEVVRTAATAAQAGDVVILCPAAASFDQFASYNDRGDQFVAAVQAL
ncbi:MAG: UDP-N-acetylmuramoyl-L-alanine--D-glutamate ligase [Candidatus Saccharimonas sp.]|jgi:UDP-N-acetylmuramoyl-L-alanine--D-glutamate ligase|nr:MAG: UDP-N-acetylmuramoyl-L-alanine--D-glutamate ligase [Candidatus Saccharimonas sp.]